MTTKSASIACREAHLEVFGAVVLPNARSCEDKTSTVGFVVVVCF